MLWAGREWGHVHVAELLSFCASRGFGAVEADAVDGGVGVADGVERVDECGVTVLVDGFGEQEDGAAVGGGLLAEHVDGVGNGVEDGGLLVAGIEVVERARDEFEVGCEAMQQDGRAVKADDGDLVIDVADEVGEHRAKVLVLLEMAGAGASGFDDDDHGQRLVAGVLLQTEWLLDTVVGENEVFGLEGVDELAGFGAHQGGDDDETGANGDGGCGRVGLGVCWGIRGRCLRWRDGCGEQHDEDDGLHSLSWIGSYEFSVALWIRRR